MQGLNSLDQVRQHTAMRPELPGKEWTTSYPKEIRFTKNEAIELVRFKMSVFGCAQQDISLTDTLDTCIQNNLLYPKKPCNTPQLVIEACMWARRSRVHVPRVLRTHSHMCIHLLSMATGINMWCRENDARSAQYASDNIYHFLCAWCLSCSVHIACFDVGESGIYLKTRWQESDGSLWSRATIRACETGKQQISQT